MGFPGFNSESALYRHRGNYRTRRISHKIYADVTIPQLRVGPLSSECCRFCALTRQCCMEDASYCWCVPCSSGGAADQRLSIVQATSS